MFVQPTARWINPIAVPSYGIVRRSRNQGTVDVIDPIGVWLIEHGYAVEEKSSVAPEPATPLVPAPTPAPTPAPAPIPLTEPVKPKKTPTKPEKDSND